MRTYIVYPQSLNPKPGALNSQPMKPPRFAFETLETRNVRKCSPQYPAKTLNISVEARSANMHYPKILDSKPEARKPIHHQRYLSC